MATNNVINVDSANFNPSGSWNFSGPVSMSGISSATKTNLLFYDSTTKVVSYGAASAAGFSDIFVTAISLFGTGFFTADPNCKVMVVQMFGAGGGGAGAMASALGAATAGGGGGSGAYASFTVLPPVANVGFAWTIGAPGAGGGSGAAGGNGGDTIVLGVTAGGGFGAPIATTSTTTETSPSGAGGTVSGVYGTGVMIQVDGNPGVDGLIAFSPGFATSGAGGNAPFYFSGGKSVIATAPSSFSNGVSSVFCAGGSGGVSYTSSGVGVGGDGGAGYLIITQYI